MDCEDKGFKGLRLGFVLVPCLFVCLFCSSFLDRKAKFEVSSRVVLLSGVLELLEVLRRPSWSWYWCWKCEGGSNGCGVFGRGRCGRNRPV